MAASCTQFDLEEWSADNAHIFGVGSIVRLAFVKPGRDAPLGSNPKGLNTGGTLVRQTSHKVP